MGACSKINCYFVTNNIYPRHQIKHFKHLIPKIPQTPLLLCTRGGKKSPFQVQRSTTDLSGTVQYSPSIIDVSGHQPAYFYNS